MSKLLAGAVAVSLLVSSACTIASIPNGMSGHTAIWADLRGYLVTFSIFAVLFCIFFLGAVASFDPPVRKQAIFLFVGVAYMLSLISLHLSTTRIKTSYV